MYASDKRLLSEVVNLRTVLTGVGFGVCGLLLLLAGSNKNFMETHRILACLATQVGGLFLVTASITTVWDLYGKRAFAEEVLDKANVSKEIAKAGVVNVMRSLHGKDVDWEEFFETGNEIDLFFSYARTWRGAHIEELRKFVSREKVKLRVILPDPNNDGVVQGLATRYNKEQFEIKKRIIEAVDCFKELSSIAGEYSGKVEIWYFPDEQTFSFYCSNRIAIITLYTHGKKQVSVPTIVCKKPGTLYDYIREEISAMIDGEAALAKKALPEV